MLFPCTVVHEPPYQTYSSVWCAGFRRRFPRMNDRTDSTLVWGSLRLAPITAVTLHCDTLIEHSVIALVQCKLSRLDNSTIYDNGGLTDPVIHAIMLQVLMY